MSATVDERIVAAKFDASDFEKGVNKTIKKLDELKKSLDLKDTTKSVNELSEKVKTSTDSVSGSLDKLTNRLTTFTGMIKQQILSGLAQEVSDVFLKMERAVTGFVRSLGSEQVSAGMAKYEQMLSSVRTMMAAGESQDSAYSHIQELRDYSDQTSYSLSQMTDALSKFRAAGVDLDTATKSVEGIANACATAGINATDAQRAFYNLSQAYSTGSLKYTDYRSLELLNMTTEKFKQNLLEAAEEAGTLKRLSDGTYKTIGKQGEKITKGKKVTLKNIQEALRYGFVTKDVMNKLFGGKYYFSEKEFRNYKKKYTDEHGNLTEAGRQRAIADAKKDFNEYAVEAYLAAREARNFTDVMNTLKDVVSTGWSTTFESLFGKLESATKFFTSLTEGPLAEVIYKIGEYRNAILGFFNGEGTDYEGSGAQMIQDIILNLSDAFGILLQTFQQILPGFEELNYEEGKAQPQLEALGNKLREFTADVASASLRIKEGVEAFNTWMNSPIFDKEKGPSRIEVIRQAISNLLSVFSIAYKLFEFGFNTIIKVVSKAAPIFDAVFAALEKITEPLSALDNNTKPFQDLEDSANNLLKTLDPIITGLTSVLGIVGEVGKFFAEMAIDTVTMNLEFFSDVLRFFIDLFTNGESSQSLREGKTTLDGIREAFEGIKEACSNGLNTVKEFLGSLIKDVRQLFGLVDENGEKIQNGGVFENLRNFFDNNQFIKDAKAWVDQAITDVSNFIKDIPNKIMKLGANIYDTLYKLFFTEETKYNGATLETKTVLTPLGEWMDQVIKDIKQFFIDLPGNIIKGVGDVFSWIDTIFNNWFGQGNTKKNEDAGKKDAKKEESEVLTRFNGFIDSIVASIKAWFDDLPNKIRKGLSSIGSFFTKLYAAIDEFLFGKKITKVEYLGDKNGKKYVKVSTTRIKSGFSKFLDDIIKEVKAFIIKIPEYVKEGIKGFGDIISTIVNALFGNDDEQNADPTKKVEEQIKKPFLGIDWTGIWNTIKEIGQTLMNQVARIFTGTDDVEVNAEWFSNTVAQGIEWIRTKAVEAFGKVEEFITSIPSKIASWFTGEGSGESKETQEQGPIGRALSSFAESIGQFIANIPTTVLKFVEEAITAFGTIWDKLYNAITNTTKENQKYAENELGYPVSYSHNQFGKKKSAWDTFVEQLGSTISKAFEELPGYVAEGIALALVGLDALIGQISGWFSGAEAEQVKEETKVNTEQALSSVAVGTDEGQKASESRLQTAFDNIGATIQRLITETIPKFISAAWAELKRLGSQIWEGIQAIFDDTKVIDEEGSPVAAAVKKMGETIKKAIVGDGEESKGLVGWINGAFEDIGKLGANIWTGIQNIFNGTPEGAFQTAVYNFGVWIGDVITKDIPAIINAAFEAVSRLITGKSAIDIDSKRDSSAYWSNYVDSMKTSADKATEDAQKPGFWSFITNIKDAIVKAFGDIGPSILNGLATAFEWLSNVGDTLVSIMTGKKSVGDQLEDAYGEEKPELAAALKRIGESLKNFFISTLPKILGSAIVSVSKYASEFWSNFMGSFSKGVEDAAKGDEGLLNLDEASIITFDGKFVNPDNPEDKETFLGKVLNIFKVIGEVAKMPETQGVVLIIALTLLLKQLKNAMSIADEIDAVSGTFKWVAIVAAIAAIGYIMSSILDIIKTGDKEKIDAAERMLNKVGEFLNTFAWIMGLMTAGKIATAIGDIGATTAENGGLVGSLIGGLGGFLTAAGTGLGINISADLIGDAVKSLSADVISVVTDITASIDTIMEFINPFIDKVTDAGNKVDDAIAAIGKIKDLYVALYKAFESLYQEIGGSIIAGKEYDQNLLVSDSPDYYITDVNGQRIGSTVLAEVSMKAFMANFESIIDVYVSISTFLNSLSDALEKVGNIDNVEGKIEQLQSLISSEPFNKLISIVFNQLYSLYNKIIDSHYFKYNNTGLEISRNLTDAFAALGSIMTTITAALNGLDSEKSTNFVQAMELLETIADKFDKSGKDLSLIGNRIALFGYHMRNFYGYISEMKGFGEDEVKSTNAKIDSVIKVVEHMASCAALLDQYGGGFKFLPDLGTYITSMGASFGGFVTQLNEALPKTISDERINTIGIMTSSIAALLASFGDLGKIIDPSALYGEDYYATLLDQLFISLNEAINNPTNNKLAGITGGLYNIISTPLTTEDAYEHYHTIGADIARELYAGIQGALDNPDNGYKPEVTPIIKTDSIKSQLDDYFLNGGFTPEIDASAVIGLNADTDAKLDEIKAALDSINESIVDLKNNTATTADVAKAIGGWTIKTNTGALVGAMTPAIDRAIGERIWLVQRRNTID